MNHYNSFFSPPEGSPYKGKNYDPNYAAKRRNNGRRYNNNNTSNSNDNENNNRGRRPHTYQQRQYQKFAQQQVIEYPQQHYEPQPEFTRSCDNVRYFLDAIAQSVDDKIRKDRDGDIRICDCRNEACTQCFHAVTDSYEELLVDYGMLQHDTIELLNLLSKNATLGKYISIGLLAYLESNPETALRTLIEST
ncbi:hypothetical protein F5Y09DRAFT_354543 [Xylaria sp. FL1042]|nr:hypothetical protein F5Y09DRAFT_354543 [Xylaria sp. FL1042]